MKTIFILVFAVLTAFGEELERIERIVHDVGALREKYEACQGALERFETAPMECEVNKAELVMRQKAQLACEERLEQLQAQRQTIVNTTPCQECNVSALHQQIDSLKLALEVAQKRYAVLEAQKKALPKPSLHVTRSKSESVPVAVSASAFSKAPEAAVSSEAYVWAEARAYRLLRDADIYDAPSGKVVQRWEAQRSFTSMQGQKGWVRITGYFVDKQWRPSREESLWVRAEDTLGR